MECRRLLLQAGADPTINSLEEEEDAYWKAVSDTTVSKISVLAFTDANDVRIH